MGKKFIPLEGNDINEQKEKSNRRQTNWKTTHWSLFWVIKK